MSIYTNDLQKAYIAYFGRPADAEGLAHWESVLASDPTAMDQVYAEFAASAEYQETYEGFTGLALINEVYNNLFNRDAEGGTDNYWYKEYVAGRVTINDVVIEVLNGASGTDLVAVNSKVAASNAFTAEFDTAAEIIGYAGAEAAAKANAWLAGVYDAATLAAAIEPEALEAAVADVADNGDTFYLTGAAEKITGTDYSDMFIATEDTLDLGDTIDGGDGVDTLDVSVSGSGITLAGFEAESLEVVSVKSLSTTASTVDFSDVNGLTTIISNETEGAALTFRDLQSVNDIDISIIDTNEVHNFTYDATAYSAAVDAADITLEEIRNEASSTLIQLGTVGGALGDSSVDQVNISSMGAVENEVEDLNVGDMFEVLNIDGEADLEIVSALDAFVNVVDAEELEADLTLDMSEADIDAGAISYTGAQGDNAITFGEIENDKTITTFAGNDTIDAGMDNDSDNDIDSGAGDDLIITALGDDTIASGAGADVLLDFGGNNVITAGSGADGVNIYGEGDNNIDLGTDNDVLVMQAQELDVADTITGGAGVDTFELYNEGGAEYTGVIELSETQRTTSMEVFDLRDYNIYLTLTDNLVETAQDNALTVSTLEATGLQTVDITNITAPDYNFTLEGGENQDIVIANDLTVNSMSDMSFGDGIYVYDTVTYRSDVNRADTISVDLYAAIQDTLVIEGGATLRPSDTANIDGLERIELKSVKTNEGERWTIELTDALLDQTTDVDATEGDTQGTLTISVDPDVPEGSELYLVMDVASVTSDVNVLVERNSNVTVYLNGVKIVADGVAADYAGEGALYVNTMLSFTENADNLQGTELADTFYADSLSDMQPADYANGYDDLDTLVLGAGIYSGRTLEEQFNGATIESIEELTFSDDVDFGVNFNASYDDDTNEWGAYDFTVFNLTDGNDTVTDLYDGQTVNALGGDDYVEIDYYAYGPTVNGGAGDDTIAFEYDGTGYEPYAYISDVETVLGSDDANWVGVLDTNTADIEMFMYGEDDTASGSNNAGDTMDIDGGDDYFAYAFDGDDGDHTIIDGGDSVYGNDGDDDLTVNNVEYVDGGEGDDTITSGDDSTDGSPLTFISGGAISEAEAAAGDTDDDTINLDNEGADVVIFGEEADHVGSDPVFVSSGYDVINNFAAGADPDVIEDVLYVGGLVDNDDVVIGNFADGVDLSGGEAIGVVWNVTEAQLTDNTGDAFSVDGAAGTIGIADNGEAVIAFSSDAEGDNVASVTLAYVCDTDDGVGQTWEVTIIGQVNFDELTGLNAGTLASDNFSVTPI